MSPFVASVRRGVSKVKEYNPIIIATSHGAVLENGYIDKAIKLYEEWSKEIVNEIPLVVIPYASAYNYTKQMALIIKTAIEDEFSNKINIELYDLVEVKVDHVVKRIKQSNAFLIGSATIVRDTLPTIWEILAKVHYEELKGKIATSFGSYGWSGEAVDNINQRLEQLKMKPLPGLKIKFKPSEAQEDEIYEFGKNFAQELKKIL